MSLLALDIIAENKAKHARGEDASYLDLGNCGLTELPDLSGMDWVETLILSDRWGDFDDKTKQWAGVKSLNTGGPNKLDKIPPKSLQLPQLKKLVTSNLGISDCQFLEKFKVLNTLYIWNNQISDGQFLEKLTNLNYLNVGNNQISGWQFLEKLTNLTNLNISTSQISDGQFLEELTNLTALELSHNQIRDVRFLEKLTNLTTLNLGYNQISDGQFLEKLTNLTTLNLGYNQISDGQFLEKLTNLITLDLGYNQINNGRFLEKLTNLTTLHIGNNQISNGRFLEKLTNLTTLFIGGSKISDGRFLEKLTNLVTLDLGDSLFDNWSFLEKLTNLASLYIGASKFTDGQFLEKLTSLTTLDLRYNQISNFHFLEKLTNLTTLHLDNNKISDGRFLEKMTGLNEITLTNNQLTDLAPLRHFFEKEGMQVVWKEWYGTEDGEINVKGNPFSNPPIGIVEQGNAAILNYFKQIEAQGGTAPLFEAKLIIVGEPDAGKTTLFQILKNPQHLVPNPHYKTTTGVKVEEGWRFPHPKLPKGIEFSANLWDFGGQEIQYMTHQFFLTARSLYVILTDDRRENANMAYWFSAADLFGRDDSEQQSPILVALNSKEFKSASKFDFDLNRFQNDYEHLQIEERRFDFASEGGYGRTDLIDKIKEMLVSLPHIGDHLPRRWPEIREVLRECGKQANHINEAEFCRICTENDIPKSEDQFYLSRYLHDLGSILHFQNDPELRDFIILNPSWAVAAVYSVLENKKVVAAEGMFDDTFLGEVWGERYSRPEQSNLLRLMKRDRFEVCFELAGEQGKYLAPQLLSPSRPNFAWPKKGLLRFHFQYQFLPKGIVTRLHVRKHDLVAKDENGKRLAWDKGAVFQIDGCQAMVEERELKDRRKIIEIAVKGPIKDRIFLLKLLRKEIESIHKKWFSKVTFERMVPCCCSDCVSQEEPNFYEFSELLKYERKNEKFIKCSKSEDLLEVSVYELLDGIFLEDELIEYRESSARKSGGEHHYHGPTYVLNDNSIVEQVVPYKLEEDSKKDELSPSEPTTNIPDLQNNRLMKNYSWLLILLAILMIWVFFSWANPGSKLDFFGWFKVEQGTNPPHEENIAPSQVTVIGSIKINNQNAKGEEVKKVYIKDQTLVKPTTLSGNVFKLESVKVPESRIIEIALEVKGATIPPSALFELPPANANKTCDLGEVLIEVSWPKPSKSGSGKITAPVIVINNSNVIQNGDKQ